jgi:cytochrome oxidase Cu insertion factor (SCO1/SenC/PrrC family)
MRILILAGLLLAAAPLRAADAGKELLDFKMTAVTTKSTSTITKQDLLGKIWVADFIFTRCQGPCPFVSARMQKLQKRLPEEIKLVSFTVDPNFDQAKQLRAYAKKFHADPDRWVFVTAPNEAAMIPLLKDSFGTAFKEDKHADCGYTTTHSSKFALIGPDGRIKGMYVSKEPEEIARLEREALALLKSGL